MGWYFSSQSLSDLIKELTRPQDTACGSIRVVAHTLRGNVLWSVVEITAKQAGVYKQLAAGESTRFIRCDLLKRSCGESGYKPLEESMHPFYYSCPLAYLDMAPEQCPEWRDAVRAYHASKRVSPSSTTPPGQ